MLLTERDARALSTAMNAADNGRQYTACAARATGPKAAWRVYTARRAFYPCATREDERLVVLLRACHALDLAKPAASVIVKAAPSEWEAGIVGVLIALGKRVMAGGEGNR